MAAFWLLFGLARRLAATCVDDNDVLVGATGMKCEELAAAVPSICDAQDQFRSRCPITCGGCSGDNVMTTQGSQGSGSSFDQEEEDDVESPPSVTVDVRLGSKNTSNTAIWIVIGGLIAAVIVYRCFDIFRTGVDCGGGGEEQFSTTTEDFHHDQNYTAREGRMYKERQTNTQSNQLPTGTPRFGRQTTQAENSLVHSLGKVINETTERILAEQYPNIQQQESFNAEPAAGYNGDARNRAAGLKFVFSFEICFLL